ncbi:MAG: agmatinase [Armatimonadota bacterium]|nr:agmatinase [Armatimonadota bacterium]MDR7439978.1 agmatinase [Armatimonadota bacterium]MDR7562968.1 agmatinase [Armatimonadota bacterium]MDR7603009.1 agmatinase [Armatimonadota bacterium]
MRFLGTRRTPRPAAAILGVPYDGTQSYRRGAAQGPEAIRAASWSLETYSPEWKRDLQAHLTVADLGDLSVAGLDPSAMVEAVARAVASLDANTAPVLLGGDHTLTLGAVRALAARHPDLMVVQLDAHADLREAYEGNRLSHACVMRRVWEAVGDRRIVQLGIRSGTPEEFAFARAHCRWSLGALIVPDTVRHELQQAPVYLTLDLDVLDPAFVPGVGNPEPGGPSFQELCGALRNLGRLRVVGLDVVELAPPMDPSGVSAVVAAKLLRELLLQFFTAG